MRILILGSGGREQALFHKISQSPFCEKVDVCPGNGGFPVENILDIDLNNFSLLSKTIIEKKYDLVVVGPEQFLVRGVVDELKDVCAVFGPTMAAAQLEGSKSFSKNFMKKYGIPTANAEIFTNYNEALAYLKKQSFPIVIKADGLAAGKGVVVAKNFEEANSALQNVLLEKKFGEAGNKVLIENFLKGKELSIFALCDGVKALPMTPAQDFKRAYDNDLGPNTGGMGAYSPIPFVNKKLLEIIQKEVLNKVIDGMQKEKTPYRGLLYAGLMVDGENVNVVEFNVRFGDPETQVVLNLLEDDLLPLLYDCAEKQQNKETFLSVSNLNFINACAIVVVMAAEGYPENYIKGINLNKIPSILKEISKEIPHEKVIKKNNNPVFCYHAGSQYDKKAESGASGRNVAEINGGGGAINSENILSNGGRVLNIVGVGENLESVRENIYDFINKNKIEGLFFRKDIALLK